VTLTEDADLTAAEVAWDIEPLVDGQGRVGVDALLDRADSLAAGLESARGTVAAMTADQLAELMTTSAAIGDLVGRAASYAALRFSVDSNDGALLQHVEERTAALQNRLVFVDLEWAALDDARAEELLSDPALEFCRHHLRSLRRFREHLLSEREEQMLTDKAVTGRSAWVRLFSQLSSEITVELPGPDGKAAPVGLEQALSRLQTPDRDERRHAAQAITAGLEPGLRTRAFVYNTLLQDKAVDDRLRRYPTWISSWNLHQEASDESVAALVEAVRGRYDLPRRWYRLKAELLGHPLADFDRMASVAGDDRRVGWAEATAIVHDAYRSFSDELAGVVERFTGEGWIDAPLRPAKRPGAFCAYTVPSHHPYVFLNWTGRSRDVLTLAHELGHAVHGYLAREQGIFHQSTPLTLAETASVFGEAVTFGRLLGTLDDPAQRLTLLAERMDDIVATVFRQVAMNRFEEAAHTERRDQGELSVDRIGELWIETQSDLLGDAVELTEGYRSWWSYIPHFIGTPGYVYAYAYGLLLALSVYRRYEERGAGFVPRYLDLLKAGGSRPPEELARIVDCDLEDPSFWDGGLAIVEAQLDAAEAAAREAGRLR
jgi:oligoendopeptidase F